jgi:glycine cleavage system protein P-like pyridoxal-binding family
LKVVIVKCDASGNIDVDDLQEKAQKHTDNLSAIMVTYPSTHGVFEVQADSLAFALLVHKDAVVKNPATKLNTFA